MQKIYLLLFSFCFSFSAFAQIGPGTIINSEIVKQYRKIKNDLEDKAKTAKDLPKANHKDVEDLQASYKLVQKTSSDFLKSLSAEIENANNSGRQLQLADFDKAHLTQVYSLYNRYQEEFLIKYENLVGQTDRPIMNTARLDSKVGTNNSDSKLTVTNDEMKLYVDKDLAVENWSDL